MSSSEQRKGFWTEQDIRDAHRLLRVLDERSKKKASGGLYSPEKFDESRATHVPASDRENGGQKASTNNGSAVLKPSGHQATPPRGGNGSDHTAKDPRKDSSGLGSWRGSGPVETREGDVAMRPPAQPSAGSYSNGFTIEAEARNARSGKSD